MPRGFVYLAAIVDVASRRVLSHRVSIAMEAAFCVEALEEAMAKHGKQEIFNTDQGILRLLRAGLTWPLEVSRRANRLCGQSVRQLERFKCRQKLTLGLDHLYQALQPHARQPRVAS